MANVKRPLWSYFIPRTPTSYLRSVSYAAPKLLFGVAATSIVLKQSYYRNTLAEEDPATWDRLERRSYVALPDGRMAQVYPVIRTKTDLSGTAQALIDALNPLP